MYKLLTIKELNVSLWRFSKNTLIQIINLIYHG
jgi:hypothetical protein